MDQKETFDWMRGELDRLRAALSIAQKTIEMLTAPKSEPCEPTQPNKQEDLR